MHYCRANQKSRKSTRFTRFQNWIQQSIFNRFSNLLNGVDKYFGSGNRFSVVNIGIAIPLTFGATKAKIKALEYQKQSLQMHSKYQTKLLLRNCKMP
jgi:cobalt-zinc-cadmium resistance protein CzcA